MVRLSALWLPILLSAVIVFLASFVLHMVLRYHWGDHAKLPAEDDLLAAMRKAGVQPGNYSFPHCASPAEMSSEHIVAKLKKGPVGFVSVLPSGGPSMGKQLVLWFIYSLAVSGAAAYVAGRTLGAGTQYLQVFRVAGTAAFLAYAGSAPIESIWKGRSWSTTIKEMMDGLIYALLTAGVFGWLWPR